MVIVVAYLVSSSITTALKIGFFDVILKIVMYYAFDHMWISMINKKYPSGIIFMTGLSGAGKTTIAYDLQRRLAKNDKNVVLIDGDYIRKLFNNTSFDKESRHLHIVNVGRMAAFLESQGHIVIVSLISPIAAAREECRLMSKNFIEVYVSTPIDVCESRDVKGLYKKARKGEILHFTGIHNDATFEPPVNPSISIDTSLPKWTLERSSKEILKLLRKK
jgi:adenylylsulfate kinase